MLCVFLMLIRPRTKASERLNSEHPVCSPDSMPMAAAWCRGLKPLCFSMQIAYLLLNSEAGRFQGLWALHTQISHHQPCFPKRLADLFPAKKQQNETDYLSFLRLLTSQLICKSPSAFRCEQLRLRGLGRSGDAPRGQRLTTVLCNGGFQTETFSLLWGLAPRCLRSPRGSAGCWWRHGLLGCGPGNLTGLPGPQGCNLWLWPH